MTDRGAGLAVLPVLDLEGDGGAALGGEALLLLEGLAGRTRRDRDVLVEPAPRVHRSPVRARVCVWGSVRGVGGRARGRSSQPHSERATRAEGREGKEGCSRESTAPHPVSLLRACVRESDSGAKGPPDAAVGARKAVHSLHLSPSRSGGSANGMKYYGMAYEELSPCRLLGM